MATSAHTRIAHVRVAPIERGRFLITCSGCLLHTIRPYRHEADELAAEHQRSHVASTATTQHEGLDLP